VSPIEFAGLVGATVILTRGSIFARVRALWPALLACPLCAGFWIGLGGAMLLRERAVDTLLAGCAVGAAAWIVVLVGLWLDGH
jgi:hypothetical protein